MLPRNSLIVCAFLIFGMTLTGPTLGASSGWLILVPILFCLCFGIWRLYQGPSVSDRVVAFDYLTTTAILSLGAAAFLYQSSDLVDVMVLVAVLSFVGTSAFAYFIEVGGKGGEA